MRGPVVNQTAMLSASATEHLVPRDDPIRRIKPVVDALRVELELTFRQMYSAIGRPSIPPEQVLKASVLMAMYSVRSERQFCERLPYDMRFRWSVDLGIEETVFGPTTFSTNRERLLTHEVADKFFPQSVAQVKLRGYVSNDHFTADGSLLEAWAFAISFTPRDPDATTDKPGGGSGGRNPEGDFHGETRSNATHQSTTDPDALLARKSHATAARLAYIDHVLRENRRGLIVETELTQATGVAERQTAIALVKRLPGAGTRRRTLGVNKGYDTGEVIRGCRDLKVTPHVARNLSGRCCAIDERTTRHAGYAISQRLRTCVEEIVGGKKSVGGCRKRRVIGRERNRIWTMFSGATVNLTRIATLERQAELRANCGRRMSARTGSYRTLGPLSRRAAAKGGADAAELGPRTDPIDGSRSLFQHPANLSASDCRRHLPRRRLSDLRPGVADSQAPVLEPRAGAQSVSLQSRRRESTAGRPWLVDPSQWHRPVSAPGLWSE